MNADIERYLALITSEHRSRDKFKATVSTLVQPMADQIVLTNDIPELYDLDVTVGEQEDVVGQWVGRSRFIDTPILGVYFSWDTLFVGWDEGQWWQKTDSLTQVARLADEPYRQLLRAKIQGNIWDGTKEGAYKAWQTLFGNQDTQILIQDNLDMSMLLAFWGKLPDALTRALVTGGYLGLKPAGVRINYMIPTIEFFPFFGFDAESPYIAGWDEAAWGNSDLDNPVLLYMRQGSASLAGEANLSIFAGPYTLLSPSGLSGVSQLLCDAGAGAGLSGVAGVSPDDTNIVITMNAGFPVLAGGAAIALDALEYPYRLSGTLSGAATISAPTIAKANAYGTISGAGSLTCFANVH